MIIENIEGKKGFHIHPEHLHEKLFLILEKILISQALVGYLQKEITEEDIMNIDGVINGIYNGWKVPEYYQDLSEEGILEEHIDKIEELNENISKARVIGEDFFKLISDSLEIDLPKKMKKEFFKKMFSSNYCQNMVKVVKDVFQIAYCGDSEDNEK